MPGHLDNLAAYVIDIYFWVWTLKCLQLVLLVEQILCEWGFFFFFFFFLIYDEQEKGKIPPLLRNFAWFFFSFFFFGEERTLFFFGEERTLYEFSMKLRQKCNRITSLRGGEVHATKKRSLIRRAIQNWIGMINFYQPLYTY